MRILYDHQIFSLQKYGGISKYFSELFRNLTEEHEYKISILHSDNHYLANNDIRVGKTNLIPNKEFKGKFTLKQINYLINQNYSKRFLAKNTFDLFHPTFYNPYFLKTLKKPYVLTVHDLIAFKFEYLSDHFSSVRPQMKEAIEKANRIIAVSENTKKDIIEQFNINPERIDVIYHGYTKPVSSNTVNSYGRYILFVGLREGYKNFDTFIKAINVLLNRERDLRIICVGKPFSKSEILMFIKLNIIDQMIAVNVDENKLNLLYSHALAFVYPSLYEGFGMPILEAFINNCPVCLSNSSCFPEIAGNAGVYFDPNNEESIRKAIEKVLYNKEFALEKINEGKKRLADFSWEKAAYETVLTYQRVLDSTKTISHPKVVQIQFSTNSGAQSAVRLQHAFIKANIQSNIISLQKESVRKPNLKFLNGGQRLISRIDNRIQNFLFKNNHKKFGLFSFPILGINISQFAALKEADIIYIHWALNGFLNLRNIEQIARLNKPVIFVMHDMWNITGGCHYSFSCDKYKTDCNKCQMLPDEGVYNYASIGIKKKNRLYSKYNNIYFVSPSKWLYSCAKEALVTKDKPIFYIPNIIDKTLFKSIDKTYAKEILNIGKKEKVIAFGAVSINSPYKGISYLQKALELLWEDEVFKNVIVLIFGSGYDKQLAESIPFKTKFMGYIKDENKIVTIYNAADVFIVPSLADNQPTTVQESLSCGTAVVGFEVGGIPDMIKHKENGYLAKYKDAEDVCNGIKFCLQNNLKGYMLPDFESGLTLKKHLELFDLIKDNNN